MVDTNLSTPSAIPDGNPLFEALIAATVDGVIVIDPDGSIRVFNTACEGLFGYAPQDVLGRNIMMLMPVPYREEHDGYLSHFLKTGERKIIGIGREVVGQRKDGSTFPMYLSVGEGRVAEGRFFVGIIRDLTQLKGEIALREDADRLLAQIVQSSDDAILSTTLSGEITSWNKAAERIFGYAADEAIGQHISLLIPPDRVGEEDDIIAKLKTGQDIEHFRTLRRRKNGSDIAALISVSPVLDAAGNIFGASKIIRDISGEVKAEARLRDLQAEFAHVGRLSSMGQMSSALAHELNQPLTAVTNFVEAARLTLEGSSDPLALRAISLIDRASSQTLRAGAIIRNLRDFVEKRESGRDPEDLNAVVEEAVALAFAGAADSGVKPMLSLCPSLPLVLIDRIQIQQVLINLIRNAIEAMLSSQKRELSIATELQDDEVSVTLRDTGPGLPPEVLENLFQPFNTTKEKGMGIGLTICKSIVEAHGGRIWAGREEGFGAVFYIRFSPDSNLEFAS
jgi:two-component system sensor kinase FixL